MSFMLSPGVNVTEIDLTTVIPAVATSDAAIAGVFRWGPCDKVVMVSSEDILVSRFGKPSNLNSETFFTAASFLAYSNRLHVSRASYTQGNTAMFASNLETGNNVIVIDEVSTGIVDGDAIFGTGIEPGTIVTNVVETANTTEITLNKEAVSTSNEILQYFDPDYCFNAIANTNTAMLAEQIVKNEEHFETKTFESDIQFVARFPGEMGNSLKISVCDSSDVFYSNFTIDSMDETNATGGKISFTVGSNTATVSVSNTATGDANTSAAVLESIVDIINIGDQIRVGNTTIGSDELQVTGIGAVTKTQDLGADTGEATFTIEFEQRYSLSENIEMDNIIRLWEYWALVESSPEQSIYQLQQGNTAAQDEMHVVIVDEGGKFTGVPGTILEVYDRVSRATDAKSEDGRTIFFKDVINQTSNYVWSVNDIPGAPTNDAENLVSSENNMTYTKRFVGGRDTANESNVPILSLINAYDHFKSAEEIDISLVLTGKSRGGGHGEFLSNHLIDNIAEKRKDCVVFTSPARSDVINQQYPVDAVVGFRNACRSTSYAVLDSGYKYMYDKYNDLYRWVPLNGDTAGLCAKTDNLRDPWWSPAGFNRGQIKNVVRLAWNPNQAQRDMLYKNAVNPIVSFPGQGVIMYGDKTLLAKPSAFDRINVRRLFIVIEKAIATAAKFTLFEFNDEFTRTSFVNMVTPYLRDVKGRRGIYDFAVICDETNNTGEVIDRNEFVGDIYVKPARSINFIQLNFVAVRTGVEFSEVIGNF